MILNFIRPLILTLLAITAVSCSSTDPSKSAHFTYNDVSSEALTFQARYGTDYILKGDRIAEYPDFNVSLHSFYENPVTQNTVSIYEISDKVGYETQKVTIDSSDDEKKHIYIDNTHFYYHSSGIHTINFYMPPQLLASNLTPKIQL